MKKFTPINYPLYRVCRLVTRNDKYRKLLRTGGVERGNVVMSLRKAVNCCRRLNLKEPGLFHYPVRTKRFQGDYVR
jgi:hypothetical protein